MKIGYVGGFWASNIGNSFYNLGALNLLKKVYGEENVYFIPDPPQWLWRVDNNFDFISNIDLDLIVISGPCLNFNISRVYKTIFDNFKKNNIKIAFISAGASIYTKEEAKFASAFLNNYDVEFIITRDEETFKLHCNTNIRTYNGICTSMFLNDAVNVIPLKKKKTYHIFNFAKSNEPIIEKVNGKFLVKKRYFNKHQYFLDGLEIVRTNNSMFNKFKSFVFDRNNTYYSDLPYGYISIIRNANIVFSDRVHTCACALIMGGEAMYIKGSKRSRDGRNNLFNRILANTIFDKPTSLNFDYIEKEKDKMVNFLEENS